MTVRFACAASALTLASALSAPAFAQGPDSVAVDAAAATVVVTTAGKSTEGEILGFDLNNAAAPTSSAIPVGAGTGEIAVSNAVMAAAAAAQGSETGGRSDSFTVTLNQDSFFGFYPAFNGLIAVSENVDFSFYGILWTTDAFATSTPGVNGAPATLNVGSDLWTEFGVGAAIYSGGFVIKPQIGLTNGALLSRGVRGGPNDTPTGTGGNFADGIVPSLTINYSDETFEAEYYGGYYAALRNRNDVGSLDFLHTWINAGYKFSDKISAGAHYELLSNTRAQGGATARVYQWLGPYVQFKTSNGFFARFTAGADIESGNDGDFYKLTAGFTF